MRRQVDRGKGRAHFGRFILLEGFWVMRKRWRKIPATATVVDVVGVMRTVGCDALGEGPNKCNQWAYNERTAFY